MRPMSLGREACKRNSFATVPRKRLDDLLLSGCIRAGVTIRDRTRLVSVNEQEHVATCRDLRTNEDVHISYRSLVGADGATSAVRRLLTGRNQRVAVSLEGVVPTVNDDIVCEFHPAQQGYCWYIPANQRANKNP